MADVIVDEVHSHRHGPAGRLLIATCKAFAVGAGILLILMAAMSLASIVGRTFLGSPILGDYELVQVLCAMAVSMSLPYCQIARGHVIVDFFTTRTPASVNRVLDVAAGLLLAGLAFVVAWRLAIGMVDLKRTGDASMLIGFPTWVAYAPMVLSFVLLGLAAVFIARDDLRKGVA
jgi:TRAP-type C4-dicarboxylate transport system permease small subunit